MSGKLWDIDTGYRPPQYVLYGKQRGYIDPNNDSYEEESPPTEQIIEKVKYLPLRIQDILDDVALFDYGGYLPSVSWEQIVDIIPRAERTHHSDIFFTHEERENKTIQYGFEVGSLLKVLQRTAKEDTDWTDLVWGVILGLAGKGAGDEQEEVADLQGLVEEITLRSSIRYQLSMQEQSGIDYLLRIHEGADEIVTKHLEVYEIEPVDYLVAWVLSQLRQQGAQVTGERITSILDEMFAQTDIEEMEQLYFDLSVDAKELADEGIDKNFKGINAIDVFRVVWESDTEVPSMTAAVKSGVASNATNLSSGILDRLKHTEGKEQWTKYPLVEKRTGGWAPTSYGQLIGYILFDGEIIEVEIETSPPKVLTVPELVYKYALEPEELDDDKLHLVENTLREIRDVEDGS